MSLTILVVCTANICRSPAASLALRERLATLGIDQQWVSVTSAGVRAVDGQLMCPRSLDLVAAVLGIDPEGIGLPHYSRPLTDEIVAAADLILTADRTHRRDVVAMSPAARTRTFTLRQAAQLATWVASANGPLGVGEAKAQGQPLALDPLDALAAVPALPGDRSGRLDWFITELDAARGLAPAGVPRWPLWEPYDIGDPHYEGDSQHPDAVSAAAESAFAVADALAAIVQRPSP